MEARLSGGGGERATEAEAAIGNVLNVERRIEETEVHDWVYGSCYIGSDRISNGRDLGKVLEETIADTQ
ncbi:hypothetical protein HG531_011020 [Fusarium graminearum]|nr:hypothetical protein HG531_011020 [Fusarium graminearum]